MFQVRGGRMPFQRILHALLIAAFAFFFTGPIANPADALQETPTVRTAPPEKMEPPGNQPTPPANATETERYTLSHDRYQKAVAYSRAEYTLYFISVSVGFAVLLVL